jgi:hypothetical protein
LTTEEIIIVEPGRVELTARTMDEPLPRDGVLVETSYSVVSPGTEGAVFTGLVNKMPVQGPAELSHTHRIWASGTGA